MSDTRRPYDAVKRAIDIIVASTALVVLLPVLVLTAFAIFVVDGWPVVFIHHRVGRGGREFPLVKFRTLAREMPKYSAKVSDDDPRASRLGRFLRRTGTDEFPQLVNVLTGHMSLVGPRPEQPFLVARYAPWQHRRHAIRPGLTGPWQAAGRKSPLEQSTHLELAYIEGRSLLVDLGILARTGAFFLRSIRHPTSTPAPVAETTTTAVPDRTPSYAGSRGASA